MSEMIIGTLIGIVIGGIITWAVTHHYYKKSMINTPDWARSFIEKLPRVPPSTDELLKLFQNEINEGNIKPHPIFYHVACPNCKAPINELKEKLYGSDEVTILDLSCPHCGWHDWTEV